MEVKQESTIKQMRHTKPQVKIAYYNTRYDRIKKGGEGIERRNREERRNRKER